MKGKLLFVLGIAAVVVYVKKDSIFSKKSDSAGTKQDDPIIIETASELEGKVLITETGRVFILLKGKKFAVTSDEALDDYIAANPGISRGAIGVTESQIASYPMGAMYENLVFHFNDQQIKL